MQRFQYLFAKCFIWNVCGVRFVGIILVDRTQVTDSGNPSTFQLLLYRCETIIKLINFTLNCKEN